MFSVFLGLKVSRRYLLYVNFFVYFYIGEKWILIKIFFESFELFIIIQEEIFLQIMWLIVVYRICYVLSSGGFSNKTLLFLIFDSINGEKSQKILGGQYGKFYDKGFYFMLLQCLGLFNFGLEVGRERFLKEVVF